MKAEFYVVQVVNGCAIPVGMSEEQRKKIGETVLALSKEENMGLGPTPIGPMIYAQPPAVTITPKKEKRE